MSVNVEELLIKQIGASLATNTPPMPVGTWAGRIGKPSIRSVQRGDGTMFHILRIPVEIDADEVREATGKDKPVANMELFLDLDPDTGELETGAGKNVGLGRILESYALNDGNASIGDLEARDCYATVANDPDRKDPNIIRDKVTAIKAMV